MPWRQVLVTLLCTSLTVQASPCSWVEVLHSWSRGYKAVAKLQMEETVDHWDVAVEFSENVINFEVWKGNVNKISDTYFTVSNTCYNNMVYSCQCFELPYLVRHEPMWKGNTTFKFNGELVHACEAPSCDDISSSGEANKTSITSPAATNIRVASGQHLSYLSSTSSGKVDMWHEDDNSGRQKWILKHLFDDVYNILVSGGTDPTVRTDPGKKFLSCRANGFVELLTHDDGSGRQKWRIQENAKKTYNVKVFGGTNQGKEFLSCTENGLVELYSHDDNSGRQQWQLNLDIVARRCGEFGCQKNCFDCFDIGISECSFLREQCCDRYSCEYCPPPCEKRENHCMAQEENNAGLKECIFPFKDYDGKEYNECAYSEGDHFWWCATAVETNGKYARRWGKCVDCTSNCRAYPTEKCCWPSKLTWDNLNASISGRLRKPISPGPFQDWMQNSDSKDPFCVMGYSGETLSTGQANAWIAAKSEYVVEAEVESDIITAVKFANKHHLRLVVKGTGHDYNGRSNAANSLLIWTHKMRSIRFKGSFTTHGGHSTTPVGAVTVEPGVTWVEVYIKATEKGLFVLGGSCASVGVVGFTIGGGYGTLSKTYGLAATNLLEATIITATGDKKDVSEFSDPDLFYALRGGGYGFGVVTSMTFRTYQNPRNYISTGKSFVIANNLLDLEDIVIGFLDCYKNKLIHQNWGGRVRFRKRNIHGWVMEIEMPAADITLQEAKDAWLPLTRIYPSIHLTNIPGDEYFTLKNSNAKKTNCDPSGEGKAFFWKVDDSEVSEYWLSAINTRYLKYDQFLADTALGARKLMKLLHDLPQLTEQIPVIIHLNMAQYGVTGFFNDELRKMPLPPSVKDSFGLLHVGFGVEHYSPLVSDVLQHGTSNIEYIQRLCRNRDLDHCASIPKIREAMETFRSLTPGAGSYFNMAAYIEPDFEENFWGAYNYKYLTNIKNTHDENGLFYCHNCVGSEKWKPGGMCRL